MHVLASSCVFSEHTKQAYTCPGATLWTTGPTEDRFLKNILLFLSLLCACLLAAPSTFFLNWPSNWLYLSSPIISSSFFPQPCERVVVYFPSASLSPSWKSGKTSSVCLAQSRFVPPQDLTPFSYSLLPLKKGRSAPEAQHFNDSRCKVVFPVLNSH